jgi:CRISPR-associated protein Csb1
MGDDEFVRKEEERITTETVQKMDLDMLKKAVAGGAVALRCIRRLQPAGAKGDKVFPPTYMGGKYAMEERVIEGKRVPCVLLDSVQSQANRMELALLEATRAGKINVPLAEGCR